MTAESVREVLASEITDVTYRPGCVEHPGSDLRDDLDRFGCSCRSWTDPPATTHPPHDHPYSHRVLCVSGWIEFTVDSGEYRLDPGDVLDLPSGVTHGARTSPDASTEYWLIQAQ